MFLWAIVTILVVGSAVFGSYKALKWPLLVLIAVSLLCQLSLYFALRWLVKCAESVRERVKNLYNWWRGEPSDSIRGEADAESYEQWKQICERLDVVEDRFGWREIRESRFYDAELIRHTVDALELASEALNDMTSSSRDAMDRIRQSLSNHDDQEDDDDQNDDDDASICSLLLAAGHRNFGGVRNEGLYAKTRVGTKLLIERYVEVLSSVMYKYAESGEWLGASDAPGSTTLAESSRDSMSSLSEASLFAVDDVDSALEREWLAKVSGDAAVRVTLRDVRRARRKWQLFKQLKQAYGEAALALSGGSSFAHFHWGACRELLVHGLLPAVLSGASGGALVAAFLGTRTDAELLEQLTPENLAPRMRPFSEPLLVKVQRIWRSRAVLSTKLAEQNVVELIGTLTFAEAHAISGRIINISVTSKQNTTTMFNHLTAPNVLVYSAVMASAALPGLFDIPILLRQRLPNGRVVAYRQAGVRWSDGSFQSDIPLTALRELYNCSHIIVAQVNPHVLPFFYGDLGVPRRHSGLRGRSWRGGFLAAATESMLKRSMQQQLRVLVDLDLIPTMLGQDWSSLFLQTYSAPCTITPTATLVDYVHVASDPSVERMRSYFRRGSIACWRKFAMIRTPSTIYTAIATCERRTRGRLLALSHLRRSSATSSPWVSLPSIHATLINPCQGKEQEEQDQAQVIQVQEHEY
jgi:predicted acylesterase/phospholipase RssA